MEKFSGPISRRYGTALFESLKELYQNNKEEILRLSDYIAEVSKCFDKDTLKIFQNQGLSFEQKQTLLTVLLKNINSGNEDTKLHECLFNFFSTIIKNKRVAYIPNIFSFYFQKSDSFLEVVRAQIVSSTKMSQETLNEFESKIISNSQKKVVFSSSIDETLKCGFLIKVGSTYIDASLKSFLTKLNEAVR